MALNIDTNNNSLDFDLAKSVGTWFQLNLNQMEKIEKEIKSVVKNWKTEAKKIGISRAEMGIMGGAFRC